MLNHSRTLLMNSAHYEEGDGIPELFKPKELSGELREFYNLIFPTQSHFHHKQFLTSNFLNIIGAAGLEDKLYKYDSRVTFEVPDTTPFRGAQISNPTTSAYQFPIYVNGTFMVDASFDQSFESFVVRQVSNTNVITVYAENAGLYITEDTQVSDVNLAGISLQFGAGSTQDIYLHNTGLNFSIYTGSSFTGTSNKTWRFKADGKRPFNLTSLLKSLGTQYDSLPEGTEYLDYYRSLANPLYKFALLLLSFIDKVEQL